ncbi:MAG: hypothetical protein HZC29_03580, partial [Thaumarchaeota archaeon]|nr:hypothetical protein [Nitrososphaerota archaeon]
MAAVIPPVPGPTFAQRHPRLATVGRGFVAAGHGVAWTARHIGHGFVWAGHNLFRYHQPTTTITETATTTERAGKGSNPTDNHTPAFVISVRETIRRAFDHREAAHHVPVREEVNSTANQLRSVILSDQFLAILQDAEVAAKNGGTVPVITPLEDSDLAHRESLIDIRTSLAARLRSGEIIELSDHDLDLLISTLVGDAVVRSQTGAIVSMPLWEDRTIGRRTQQALAGWEGRVQVPDTTPGAVIDPLTDVAYLPAVTYDGNPIVDPAGNPVAAVLPNPTRAFLNYLEAWVQNHVEPEKQGAALASILIGLSENKTIQEIRTTKPESSRTRKCLMSREFVEAYLQDNSNLAIETLKRLSAAAVRAILATPRDILHPDIEAPGVGMAPGEALERAVRLYGERAEQCILAGNVGASAEKAVMDSVHTSETPHPVVTLLVDELHALLDQRGLIPIDRVGFTDPIFLHYTARVQQFVDRAVAFAAANDLPSDPANPEATTQRLHALAQSLLAYTSVPGVAGAPPSVDWTYKGLKDNIDLLRNEHARPISRALRFAFRQVREAEVRATGTVPAAPARDTVGRLSSLEYIKALQAFNEHKTLTAAQAGRESNLFRRYRQLAAVRWTAIVAGIMWFANNIIAPIPILLPLGGAYTVVWVPLIRPRFVREWFIDPLQLFNPFALFRTDLTWLARFRNLSPVFLDNTVTRRERILRFLPLARIVMGKRNIHTQTGQIVPEVELDGGALNAFRGFTYLTAAFSIPLVLASWVSFRNSNNLVPANEQIAWSVGRLYSHIRHPVDSLSRDYHDIFDDNGFSRGVNEMAFRSNPYDAAQRIFQPTVKNPHGARTVLDDHFGIPERLPTRGYDYYRFAYGVGSRQAGETNYELLQLPNETAQAYDQRVARFVRETGLTNNPAGNVRLKWLQDNPAVLVFLQERLTGIRVKPQSEKGWKIKATVDFQRDCTTLETAKMVGEKEVKAQRADRCDVLEIRELRLGGTLLNRESSDGFV